MRYTPYGGAEVFISRFVEGLLKKGHKCHIFASKWDTVTDDKLLFHRVKTLKGPSFLKAVTFAANSSRLLKESPLDLVISFDRTLCQDIYRAGDGCHKEWLRQRSKVLPPVKRIVTYLNPLHLTYLLLERRLFGSKRLKVVITNSNRVKRELMSHYKLPEERICVIYNGVNLDKFLPSERPGLRGIYRNTLGLKSDSVVLLFVGSGFERKGLAFLIKAVDILKKREGRSVKLVVVGKGNIRKYRNMANRHGIGGDIIFTGPIKDTLGYYYACDIFVLPSIYEPFSNACLEAMAAGLPVITSRRNGVSEIISQDQEGGIVEDPTDPEQIAASILPFLGGDKREKAGIAARKKAENFSIEGNIDKFLEIVEGMG